MTDIPFTSISDAPAADAPASTGKRIIRRRRRIVRQADKRTAVPRGAEERAPEAPAAAAAESDPVERVTRVSRADREIRGIGLPNHRKKPGRDYQWWPTSVQGEPAANLAPIYHPGEIHAGGWRVEKARDWPELVGPSIPPDAPVTRGSEMLYGRPMQFTMEAREEDRKEATRMQADRVRGTLQGKLHGEQGLADIPGVRVANEGKGLGLDMEVRMGE